MDYPEAYEVIMTQGQANTDTLIYRLRQGKPPIPGQITTLLLALKVLYEGLRGVTTLERSLVSNLYALGIYPQQAYNQGQRQGIDWPPLLESDLRRIAQGVEQILRDET
jgi:hypothetical protein